MNPNEQTPTEEPIVDKNAPSAIEQSYFTEPQGDDEEAIKNRANLWKKRFGDAESNQQQMFKKWGDWYGMMYAATNTPQMALWRSKAFLPIIAAKVWDLVSRFIQYKPSWEVKLFNLPVSLPTQELQNYLASVSQKYDKIKMKLDYDYDDPMRKVSIQDEHFSTLVDAVVTGTGVARVNYEQGEANEKSHPSDVFDNVDMSLQEMTTIQRGFNNYKSINIFNFYKSPRSESIQDGWLIVKDVAGISELKKHTEYDQNAIDTVMFGKITDSTAQYQASKRALDGNIDPLGVDSTEKSAWLFDCWDADSKFHTVYLMGSGSSELTQIFREANPYWHEKIPYVRFVIRQKPHIFWGESIFENSETLQAACNDLFNHYMDSYNMADGMLAIEEGSVVEPYTVEPGGEFRYRGEAPKQLRFPEPNPMQLTTIMNQITGVIEAVTISQYASGVPNSATDTTQGTATGVTRLMEAATEKIGMMRSNVRRAWAEVGNMWLVNSQQFMTDSLPYEKVTGRGNSIELINPADIRGSFILRIDESAFEPISNDQKRENYIGYVANIRDWAKASREQAQANGSVEGIINIDYLNAVERFSELSSENASAILLEAPIAQPPTPQANAQNSSISLDSLMPAAGADIPAGANMDMLQGMNGGMATPDQQLAPTMV